ncbi:MAG: S-adenosylmethionine decarboxylase [Pseudomonadales bacterium]|nr:S-adenosylmethionine decarboxylase [Pseudomonadales bacterium]MDG1444298.1 S-adenosylmethionine decarboxylase [Pseudomonadales bacterium]
MSNLSSITRSLSFNAHRLKVFEDSTTTDDWFRRLQEEYGEAEMECLLTSIADSLGAKVLNISTVPYEPFGASGTLMMGQQSQSLGHLDASHIAVHSYFDIGERFAHFRLELEISSCAGDPGLQVQSLIERIQPDFLQIDYRVRGISWNKAAGASRQPSELPDGLDKQPGYQPVSHRSDSDSEYIALLRSSLAPAIANVLLSL